MRKIREVLRWPATVPTQASYLHVGVQRDGPFQEAVLLAAIRVGN
jgi:hypothetical protein